MRRRNRAIEIFSLSSIDLFASALGAFIIIMAILIPYYPNLKDGGRILEQMRAEIADSEQQRIAADKELAETQDLIEEKIAESQAANTAKALKQDLQDQASAIASSSDQLAKALASLRDELYRLKQEAKKIQPSTSAGVSDFSVLGITTEDR